MGMSENGSLARGRRNAEQGLAERGAGRGRATQAGPLRISGVRSPAGPLFRPATRPLFRGIDSKTSVLGRRDFVAGLLRTGPEAARREFA